MKHRNGKPLTPLLTGVCLVLLLFLSSAWLAFNQDMDRSQVKYLVNQSRRALAYKVTDTRTALFRISPQETQVELISNLDLSDHIVMRANNERIVGCNKTVPEYEYALEVSVLDADLNPVSTQVYWERTRQTEWLDESTGNPMKAAYYLYESICSADSRITTITLPEETPAERFVAVRIMSPKPAAASIRLYKHLDLSSERDVKGLRPMPRRLRTKLARHNLFGEDLRKVELNRSMYDVLSQIPAETQDGYEYTTRQLFLYDHSLPVTGDAPPRTALSTEIDRPVFFPIQGPARLKLKMSSKRPVDATIWRGTEQLAHTVRKPGKKRFLHFDFGPGEHLLKICDPTAKQRIVYSRLDPPTAWASTDKPVEDPFPVSLTAYYRALPATEGDPLIIDIPENLGDSASMIKLLCRSPLTDREISVENVTLTYSFKNDSEECIDTGAIALTLSPSDLARYYSTETRDIRVTSAQRRYILPPAGATRLEITADQAVDVAMFTRLAGQSETALTKGPAAKSVATIADVRFKTNLKTRDYFYFRPINWENLDDNQRKQWVSLPQGLLEPIVPMENNPIDRVAKSLYPIGKMVMDRLFEPVILDPNRPIPENCYVRFDSNQPTTLTVAGADGAARMGFHYNLSPETRPVLSIRVDNELVTRFRPVTFTGYFELPLLSKGAHTVEVSTGSGQGQIFMKLPGNVSCASALYRPRRVFRIDPGQRISVPLELVDHSISGLNILAYQENSPETPIQLTVSTDLSTAVFTRPQPCLTASKVHFIGSNENDQSAYLDSGTTLTQQERFFFALHKDIQPDRYDINIESNGSEPVYVRFFAMAPEDRLDA